MQWIETWKMDEINPERVEEAAEDKIERLATSKVEEEISEELSPLKSQLENIENALNQLQLSGQQFTSMNSYIGHNQQQSQELLQQFQQFSSKAQQQQQIQGNLIKTNKTTKTISINNNNGVRFPISHN